MAIYDCFTFYNEIDLLKLRLEILSPYIDYFVISECCKTQNGTDKPFNFSSHISEFEKWKDKIIYIQADDPPVYSILDPWSIENYQRNCLMRGLLHCDMNDIIFISDLDEVINPAVFSNLDNFPVTPINSIFGMKDHIKRLISLLLINKRLAEKSTSLSYFLDYTPVALEQDSFYYYLNYKGNYSWHGTVMLKFKNFMLPQKLRDNRNTLPFIKNAGWHFSYLGGKDKIKDKLSCIVEGNKLKIENNLSIDDYINECLKSGKDLFGRNEYTYKVIKNEKIGISDINKFAGEFSDFFYK